MLLLYFLIIIIICSCPILIIWRYADKFSNNLFRNHTIIFLIKLIIISMFIYVFIYNFSISNYKIFIISGTFNLTFFHALEGFLIQKFLFKNEKYI